MIRYVPVQVQQMDEESGTVRWTSPLLNGEQFTTKPDDLVPMWAQVIQAMETALAGMGHSDTTVESVDLYEMLGPKTVVRKDGDFYSVPVYLRPHLHEMMAHWSCFQPINGYVLVKPTTYELKRGSLFLPNDEATENRSKRHIFEVIAHCDSVSKCKVGDIIIMSKHGLQSMYGKSLTSAVDMQFNEFLLMHEDDIGAIVHREPLA